MKQPTLKELNKRPALWVNGNYQIRITYPDRMEMWNKKWVSILYPLHIYAKENYIFLGWL